MSEVQSQYHWGETKMLSGWCLLEGLGENLFPAFSSF